MTYYGLRYKVRPCPGCGEKEHRPEGILCNQCAHLLEVGRCRVEELEALADGTVKVRLLVGSDCLPHRSGTRSLWPHAKYKDLLAALAQLAQAESPAQVGYRTIAGPREPLNLYNKQTPGFTYRSDADWIVTHKQAEAIETVLGFIEAACKHYLDEGIRLGSDLLAEVARGGIAELNRLSISRKQE